MTDNKVNTNNINPLDLHLQYEIISATNGFFGTVRNITMDSGYVTELDLSELHQLINNQKPDLRTEEVRALAWAEIGRLRTELANLDQQLDTGKFRRVFERIGGPSTHSLELIIQYYLSKEDKTAEDRDKIDLLATRWGSFLVSSNPSLHILRLAKDLPEKINNLYKGLDLEIPETEAEEEILKYISSFLEEINNTNNFRDIVEKQIVRRLREYKASIDHHFYRPNVLSSTIEVNIAIHNLFQQLYDSEQARLHLYLEQAKKTALNDQAVRQAPQTQPFIKIVDRAYHLDNLLEEIKQTLSAHPVVDQAFTEDLERTGQKMRDVSEMLISALQNTRHVSEQLHRGLNHMHRREQLAFSVSSLEKQLIDNIAQKLGRTTEHLLKDIFENALISLAEAAKEDRLNSVFPSVTDKAAVAVTTLIGEGLTATSE